jgi:hypothetical protein
MPGGDHFARQWRLLQQLGRPAGLAVEEAAGELGCAVRTVWRDLRVLQDAGFPIFDERDGRHGVWKVEDGFRDRLPVPLSLPEVVALLVSRDLLDAGGAGPFGPAVTSAFDKIRALLTPRALELVERMRQSVGARTVGAKLQLGTGPHLATIHRALAEGRTLQMRYYSLSRDAKTERRVDPYQLTFFKHDGAFARRPEFQVLFRRLLGRLSALARFHGDGPLDVDFRGLIDAAGHVKLVSDEARPTRWARYSARQDRRMQWEGLEGSVVYEGDLAPFWRYLVFGQWTHVGSGATFGLGGYRIER